jgi:hypothetical protein
VNAVGADDQGVSPFGALLERDADPVERLLERLDRSAEADGYAVTPGALKEDALEIGAPEVDVTIIERATHALDRHSQTRAPRVIDVFHRVDRVSDRPQGAGEVHSLCDIPAGPEEIHHVPLRGRRCLALDDQGMPSSFFQEDGQCQPRDAAAVDQDGVLTIWGCFHEPTAA